jgi:hypothetical protein
MGFNGRGEGDEAVYSGPTGEAVPGCSWTGAASIDSGRTRRAAWPERPPGFLRLEPWAEPPQAVDGLPQPGRVTLEWETADLGRFGPPAEWEPLSAARPPRCGDTPFPTP